MLSTILEGASIVDGTGGPRFTTDVGLAGDRIALIGDLSQRDAARREDARGKVLVPGFIDVHSHSDQLWLVLPGCDGKVAQGVTTEIGGNCGFAPAPLVGRTRETMVRDCATYGLECTWSTFAEFFDAVERNGVALNVAILAGLGTTRSAVAGDSELPLSAQQLADQARLVREACEQGALGVSSGLIYVPGRYADLDELVALANAAREGGAPLYASHVRSEGDMLIEAIDEALAIGERAQVAVQCSHHKATYKRNWGKVHRTLEAIERARTRGLHAFTDVYPYVASWTSLNTILPARVRFGGTDAAIQRLLDPQYAAALAMELELARAGEWELMLVTDAGSGRNAALAGLRVTEIAARWGLTPARAAIRLLAEEELEVGAMFFSMNEDDVAAVLSAPFTCIGSDASVRALDGVTARGVPHPRAFGTFPRVLSRFARDPGTLTFEEAIRRMTSLPAGIFGLRDRGTIAEGKFADLVLLDEETLRDTATYEKPYAFPTGIERVYVNGHAVFESGRTTGARPGRVLRGGAGSP